MFSSGPAVADIAKTTAEHHARKERERFLGVLRIAENFVAENQRVIGGRGANLMLQGPTDCLPLDAYHLLVYSPEPYKDANRLAKLVYKYDPKGLTQFTVALPRVNSSSVNTAQREIVSFRSLPFFRGVQVYKLIPPDPRPALFNSGSMLPCLGAEVQLLSLYADLCNPTLGKNWERLALEEKTIRAIFLREYKGKFAAILSEKVGGKPLSSKELPQTRKRLMALLREEFIPREGRVLFSDLDNERLACASVFPFESEKEVIERIAKKSGGEVHFLINHPQVVVDTRLRRLTVYLQGASRRDPVLDVYNVAQYEAVPYLHTHAANGTPHKLGTAYARARFILVDLWTIQLIWRMKQISDGFAHQQVKRLLKLFQNLGALDSPEEAFPNKAQHFVGHIEDPIRAERRAVARAKSAPRKKPAAHPFYPGRHEGAP